MTVALVQSKVATATGASGSTAVFDSTPTEGNLLVAVLTERDTIGTPRGTPAGFTKVTPVGDVGYKVAGDHTTMWFKVAGVAESATVTVSGATNGRRLTIAEFSGVGALADSATKSFQADAASYPVGPASSGIGLLVGVVVAGDPGGGAHPTLTNDPDYDLIATGESGGSVSPEDIVAFRVVGSGLYSFTPTGSHSVSWGGILAAFEAPSEPGLWAEFDGEWERLPVMDWRIQRGVSGDLAGNTSPGSATFTLKNPDDRYNPENGASPLAGLLADGVRVWAGINDDGTIEPFAGKTVRGVFAGYITDIEPMPVSGAGVSPTVVITCADPLEWMGRQPVRLADSRTRSQADLRAAVLDEIGWSYGRDLPAEPTTLPLSSADGLAGNVLDALNRASGTRHYIKPADNLTDWATYTAVRRTSLLDAATVATLDASADHVTETSGWRLSADGVINQQRVSVEPIGFSALRDVWEAETLPTVLTGTPYVVWAEFDDYVDGPVVEENHTGSSLTSTIEAFGRTAKITLTSSGTSVVTHLAVQGHAVIRGPQAAFVKDDAASQAFNGRGVRAGSELSGDNLGTLTAAQGLAEHIVWRFASPLGRPTAIVVNWLPEMFERDLLQLVGVTVAELAVTDKVYEIVGLTHTAEAAAAADDGTPLVVSHSIVLVLQESREQADPGWFILGSSLLGGDDILAY